MIYKILMPEISPAFTVAEYRADTERRVSEIRERFGLVPGLNTPHKNTQ